MNTMLPATTSAMSGIQPQPTGQRYQGDGHDHADGGPHVGHQVAGIRLQGDGVVAPPGAHQPVATPRLMRDAMTEMTRPSPTCSNGTGCMSRGRAVMMIPAAASRIMPPSKPLEKYSALERPKANCSLGGRAINLRTRSATMAAARLTVELQGVGQEADRPGRIVGAGLHGRWSRSRRRSTTTRSGSGGPVVLG